MIEVVGAGTIALHALSADRFVFAYFLKFGIGVYELQIICGNLLFHGTITL